jgi:Tfp pilus assembly protein PilX
MRNRKSERGVALIIALFALMIVSAIGMSLMYSSATETMVNSNYRNDQISYFAAKAGLEEARDRMRSDAGASINSSLPTALPGNANSLLYILNPTGSETVSPWTTTNAYFDDEICKEVSGCSGTPLNQGSTWHKTALTASSTYATNPVMPYKWVRINLKTNGGAYGSSTVQCVNGPATSCTNSAYYVCWTGSKEIAQSTACTSPNEPVYVLTALAIVTGGGRRMVQYELAQNQFNLVLPGALTLVGNIPAGGGNACGGIACGGNYVVDGNSPSSCSSGSNAPAVAVSSATSDTNLTGAISSTKYGNYIGSGGSPSVVDSSSSLTNTTWGDLTTTAGLNNLVAAITAVADYVDTSCNMSHLGSPTNPTIVVVNGDCNISSNPSVPGEGILLVTGQVNFADNPYNGVILAIGTGYFDQQAAKNSHFNGAIFVARTIDNTGPQFSWHSGTGGIPPSGDPSIEYDSCKINNVKPILSDFKILTFRELML